MPTPSRTDRLCQTEEAVALGIFGDRAFGPRASCLGQHRPRDAIAWVRRLLPDASARSPDDPRIPDVMAIGRFRRLGIPTRPQIAMVAE